MIGAVTPKSITEELRQVAKEFLTSMQRGDFDTVWDDQITPEAAKLLSTALLPVNAFKEGRIDEVLKSVSNGHFSISVDEAFAIGFQLNMQQVRSSFFSGMAGMMEELGWYEAPLEDCWAFMDDTGAILIDPTPQVPVILLFIRREQGGYSVDLEAMVLFAMYVSPSSLYKIGARALEIGQGKSAVAYFELAASFAPPYARVKRLMLDHPMVQHIVADARKQELLEEERYILLARHQVLTLLSSPRVSPKPVDMAQFLADTFEGYAEIPAAELDEQEIEHLYELDDGDLRKAVAALLNGVNPVVAQREANKPHGSHEISDMELAVQHRSGVYRLCIPVKSAREIKTNKVPVSIAYQIIRPFLQFPDGIVVFVTAKPCSQYLHNYIKAANDILGLSIEVIECEELGKLLKINGLLSKQEAA